MRRILHLIFILIIVISCKKEKDDAGFGRLIGYVKDEAGQPINGALVKVESLSKSTNYLGEYYFGNLEAKEYSVSVSKDTYLTKVEKITITRDELKTFDFTLTAGEPYLNISETVVKINSGAGNFIVDLTSNSGWTIQNSSSWLVCSITAGNGSDKISISYTENKDEIERKDTIQFQSGQINRTLLVIQSVGLKLIHSEGIIGNGERDISDSVYVLFNKPIQVKSIESLWENCSTNIQYTLTDNNCGIKFTYSCAKLGGNYPFKISVSDESGSLFTRKIDVPFYKSRRKIEGLMTDYLFLNDDKEILISIFYPNKLIRYSIENDSVIQTYDLSNHIAPMRIFHNPYDSKIYIVGSYPKINYDWPSTNRPDIFTLDMQTGEIVKVITVIPDEEDHPDDPTNIPVRMGFTKNGHGVIILRANGGSGLRWKLIDCADNYRIYKYPHQINNADFFDHIHMNFDQTKLIITQRETGSCDYGIFDGNTQTVSILRPGSVTRSVFIKPNRKNEKVYFGQLYDQFIMDLNGNMSEISYLDNKNDGSVDFSYKENEDNIIYFCDWSYFRLMDYNNGTTPMWCDMLYGLRDFRSTLDGKYAIAYFQASDTSNVYVIKTDSFYRHLE